MATRTEYALNVQVKHGPKILLNSIGTYNVNQTLRELFEALPIETDLPLHRVEVAKAETGPWRVVDSGECIHPALTTFDMRYICFWLRTPEPVAVEKTVDNDEMSVLMSAARQLKNNI